MSSMSPTTKKHLKVQVAAVSRSTLRVLSRGHPRTSLHAQNIASRKVSDRPTHPLSLQRTRDVRTVKPITESSQAVSARQGGLGHPSGPTNKLKEVARVSVTQHPQRVCNMKFRNDEPHVRAPAPLPKTGGAETTRSIQKTSSPSVKPTLVSSPLTLNPKAIVEVMSTSVVKLGAGATTPAEDVCSLVFGITGLLYSLSVNIPDSKVPKKSLSSTQDGYLNTPSHLRQDVSCLADRT